MKVAVIMGSISDFDRMKQAIEVLKDFGVEVETKVLSAHRTPEETYEFARTCRRRGIEVIIAGAGGAAHLPGVLASLTDIPVIGVPISSKLNGLDSLYSIVQMPPGIPVATVGIDASKNAGLLAIRILSLRYPELSEKLESYRKELRSKVESMNRELEKLVSDL